MRIRRIEITALFNLFNYTIPLNLEEHITIIHGPNGFGKTVLLQMLNGLFAGQYGIFRSVPFGDFRITLEDGSVITVAKDTASEIRPKVRKIRHSSEDLPLKVGIAKPNSEPVFGILGQRRRQSTEYAFLLDTIDERIPSLTRVGSERWHFKPTGERLSLGDVLQRFPDYLPDELRIIGRRGPGEFEEWVEIKKLVQVSLIRTQRLEVPRSDAGSPVKTVSAVRNYSEELAKEIQVTLAEYASRSQELDRTFPSRLLRQTKATALSVEELRRKLVQLEAKRTELTTLGFLEPEKDFAGPAQIEESKRDVFSVYVSDVEQKLSVFDEMAGKIKFLSNTINSRFQFKKLTISKDRGFVFTTPDGSDLSTASLSSGEQHELVLLYELLFLMKPNSLILIDEPEISLHIAWQEKFLNDLQEMVKLANFDALIATHSPEIISDRWDLTVELKGTIG